MKISLIMTSILLLVTACNIQGTSPTPAEQAWPAVKRGALLIDVRSAEEHAEGHVPGSLNIPYDQLETRLTELGTDKNREIVVYCRSGRRSGIAKDTLLQNGFKHVLNAGAYTAIMAAQTSEQADPANGQR